MLYRSLGNTGLSVSILGFGAMRLPIHNVNPDFDQAIRLIRYAIDRGINYFDVGTFYCHGYCETAFGLATKDLARDKLLINGRKMFARDYAALPVPAECCIQCDECTPQCPNHIAIPKIMEEAARMFIPIP